MPQAPTQLSLTRSEAVQRAGVLMVSEVLVELDLTLGEQIFASTTTLTFSARPGSASFADFQGDALLAATLNGRLLDPTAWQCGRIALTDLQASNLLVVEGRMRYSRDGEGMHRHVDPADGAGYLYAMSFLNAAPRWFACFDQPDLKARYEFRVQAPPDWTVLGNGPGEQLGPGAWRLRAPRPLSTYFVTLVAGPYASLRYQHDGIELGFHVRASLAVTLSAEIDDLLAVTRASFDYYHHRFGIRYPFGAYHQAFVPDFNAGAMENPGCVTLRDTLIFRGRATRSERAGRATTMAHEMAHMWFGDLVTMTWWDDLWLNESFAEYLGHRVSDEATGYPSWTEFGISRKDWGFVADQSPSTHPVAGNGAADADAARQDFDGISYAKGAAVLKQLVAYVGEDVFWSGLRDYLNRYAYGNASFTELLAALTRAGAAGLDRWADGWLRTSGLDTLDVLRSPGVAAIVPSSPASTTPGRTHVVRVAGFTREGVACSDEPVRVSDQPVPVPVPDEVALVVPDAGDDTWAKIRFGNQSWQQVGAVLSGPIPPTARVAIYNALRHAVRDAELAPVGALEMLCSTMPAEQSDVVVQSVLEFAQDQLAGSYSEPSSRPVRLLRVSDTAQLLVAGSIPGSDRQLAAFRLAIGSSAEPGRLADWLGGRALPAALRLDPELVWALVERLSALTANADLIEAALRADASSSAVAHAARARASLPTVEAKRAAWELLTSPSQASSYELYATAQGFFQPHQDELTHDYAQRYFLDFPGTARFRGGWSLARVASYAYPYAAADTATLSAARRALEEQDLAAPLRRAFVDGTDQLRRALAARQRFD